MRFFFDKFTGINKNAQTDKNINTCILSHNGRCKISEPEKQCSTLHFKKKIDKFHSTTTYYQ